MSVRTGRAIALGALVGVALGVGGCCTLGVRCSAKDVISVVGAASLNSCDDFAASAVVVRIYGLRDVETFDNATFDRLWGEGERALGDEVVASVKELTVLPGEPAQEFGLARGKGVTAIGVVVDFCDHKSGCWKNVVRLDKGSARITISLNKLCLTATKL